MRLLSDCARCVCLVRGACDRARPRRRRTLTFDYIHAGLLFVWAGPKTTTTCISFVSIGRHSERRTALCFGLLRALDFARPHSSCTPQLTLSTHSGPTAPTEQQHNLLEYAAYMRGWPAWDDRKLQEIAGPAEPAEFDSNTTQDLRHKRVRSRHSLTLCPARIF